MFNTLNHIAITHFLYALLKDYLLIKRFAFKFDVHLNHLKVQTRWNYNNIIANQSIINIKSLACYAHAHQVTDQTVQSQDISNNLGFILSYPSTVNASEHRRQNQGVTGGTFPHKICKCS